MEDLTPATIAAWTTLMTVSRTLLEQVEGALKAEGLPSLSWYDALLEIEKSGTEGIRPYALKSKLLLPQYGTSRLLDRLVAAGLIERLSCDDDKRGYSVRITEDGRKLRRDMWPVYRDTLRGNFEDRLTDEEIKTLNSLLGALGTTIND
ncbi:MarR family winged helix-turn-helix transcriptional regulator [Puniceibacterium confluentis]|uniref:MarR family winged helix-turn-helix transcriptional regulator n=1 Tax=Puniceibacterium confluentis TaxID=1958944 RepID=UPI0011B45B6B|nr:MarR family transcriptional regulator [Puniceibacterium confluentis]